MASRKEQRMKRPPGNVWSFNGDGRFGNERVKGFWKRYFQKWLKRKLRKEGNED